MRAPAGKAMNLPGRLEGPHSWMWRLLFQQADRLVSRTSSQESRNEAAEWLWSGIEHGWLWIRHDRSGLRWDEPEPWLHDLVEAEAERHLAMGDQRRGQPEVESDEGSEAETSPEPTPRAREERRAVVAGHIWRYLATGWARIADEEDRVLFWHPDKKQFMPFTRELEADYRRLFRSFRRLAETVQRRQSGNQPYTGRSSSRTVPEAPHAYVGPWARRRRPSPPAGEAPTDEPLSGEV